MAESAGAIQQQQVPLVQAQQQAMERGANALRQRHRSDAVRRQNMRNEFTNPRASFSTNDLAIVDGPVPQHSDAEKQEDRPCEQHFCCLLDDCPEISNIIFWR